MSEFNNLNEELLALGELIREQFGTLGRVSTDMVDISITEDSNLRIEYPEYFQFVDSGRRRGSRMPPTSSLREWARQRSIPTDESTLFAIARSISQDGIPPRPFLEMTFEQALDLYEDLLEGAVALDIEQIIDEI